MTSIGLVGAEGNEQYKKNTHKKYLAAFDQQNFRK
jgi:hypothetical protein